MTSEVPPKQSSNRNRSWSSGERRDSFFWTLSSTLMVAKLVSRTTSSCNWGATDAELQKGIIIWNVASNSVMVHLSVNTILVTMYVPQISHPHSDEAVPHMESSLSWRKWSPLTRREMTPTYRSIPTHSFYELVFMSWIKTLQMVYR